MTHFPLPYNMPSITHLDQNTDNVVSIPRPKVYSLNPLRSKALKLAKNSFDLVLPSDQDAGDWRQEADGLLVVGAPVSQEDLEQSSQTARLRYISKQGAGVDKIHVPTAKNHGVTVMNTPGVNAQAVAELAFGMMIT
jgi:phosphoglycerate dehydrogenase-like enzyme